MRGLVLIIGVVGLGTVHAQTPTSTQTANAPTSRDDLGPAFRTACWSGDLNKATQLLNQGAPIEGRDNLGRTPLFLACHGDPEIVKLLLAHGARIDAAENDGDLPIAHACEFGDLASAQMLLDAGAETELNHANQYGCTPLMLAAREGHDDVVSLLISHHIDVNFSRTNDSALSYAVWQDHLSTAKLLLDAGAQVTRPSATPRSKTNPPTLLALAAATGDLSLIDLLLAHGANLETRDKEGRTPLIHAGAICAEDQVRELLGRKADVNAADNQGETALTWAGDRGNTRIVKLLKAAGATRTDLHIIPKEEAIPPLSKSQLWALAVGALYAQWNGSSHAALGKSGFEGTSSRMLQSQWGISDRNALLQTVAHLERGPSLMGLLSEQARDSFSYPGVESKLVRAFQLMFLDAWWREKTNVAWDLCRAANLVRCGVQSGYLQEDEAWPLLMPIARKTQQTFHSWREMSDNFFDSREIDANEQSRDLRACARLLLNPKDPNSPWNQLPWKTDLSGH